MTAWSRWESRSTWACELKFPAYNTPTYCHVTLHVSVWVEISNIRAWPPARLVTLHVSVWVEIGRLSHSALRLSGSRSTWACELKFDGKGVKNENVTSRSTWACELKCMSSGAGACALSRHAPRERVSWNYLAVFKHAHSILVTLHVSVWVEMNNSQRLFDYG